MRRPPLVLTGGPAVGKSTTAIGLAAGRSRLAVVDVDDIRQLVVSGGVAPWQGDEGRKQAQLGARNACALAVNFGDDDIDVVIADVLTPDNVEIYRRLLPECLVVHLVITLAQAQRRAATRKVFLTPQEFGELHRLDRLRPPAADHRLVVDQFSAAQQIEAVGRLWDGSARAG